MKLKIAATKKRVAVMNFNVALFLFSILITLYNNSNAGTDPPQSSFTAGSSLKIHEIVIYIKRHILEYLCITKKSLLKLL